MTRTVAIAGGGLAGLTCAKSLVDAGLHVRVFEGLPFLGGRASTFRDADGDWIEQGLHIFLGTYSEFKKLLREIDQPPDDVLHWMTEIRIKDPAGTDAVYGTNPFRAPFKTLLSALGQNNFLGPLDKLKMLPITTPALMGMESLRERFDDMTVAQWWAQMNGTSDVLERVLRPFCRAIQFTDVEAFSAYNFLGWIHHVLYDLPHSLAGGYRGARDELIFQPLAKYLTRCGASIQTGVQLREIQYSAESNRITGFVLESGEQVIANAYVAALPAWAFVPLIPHALRRHPFFASIAELPVAPAIAVQIWFDREGVGTTDYTLMARTAVPVYQEQSKLTYPTRGGDRISTTISPADDYLSWSDAELVRYTLDALGQVEPGLREARVVKSVVLKHKQHLIRPAPGVMSARPTQVTPVPNLFLAGDWTQQDYFGSQEGAVRSGRACAAHVLHPSAS